ncbi:MAG: TolC family protein [Deltaproteobacteria bacterium]|nr:MAG: TolC family protein [Deltaproteobacteria bacterium]
MSFLSYRVPFLVLMALFILPIQNSHAQSNSCDSIKSTQDVLDCALSHHPDIQLSESSLERDKFLKSIAKQRPNPELNTSLMSGQTGGNDGLNTEFGLLIPLEVGGKRKNRIRQAIANESITQAQVLESKELTALNTVLALYRLRQIHSELATINEALSTFENIKSNYKKRTTLAPEQEISSNVFGLAADEYKLKRTTLMQEEESLKKFLELATGLSQNSIQKHLPGSKSRWPVFQGASQDMKNSALAKTQAETTLAAANLRLAKSQAWPDFKLGPTLQTQSGTPGNPRAIGMNISMSLPLLSWNRGNIQYAQRDKSRSALAYELARNKNQNERQEQILRYQSAIASLKSLRSTASMNTEHQSIEKYFEEGLIPTSLVIESHRQIFELTESMNRQELNAIDALWRLFIIDGRFLSEKI